MAFNNRLNKILLILVFLGILFILFKEKEGFANAFDTLDEVYSGALLKYFPLNSMPIIKKNERDFMSDTDANYVGDYSQKTNNPKYRKIPCEKNNYDYKICEALYKEGLIEYAGHVNDIDIEDVVKCLKRMIDNVAHLRSLSNKGQKMVDGLGVERITDMLLSA